MEEPREEKLQNINEEGGSSQARLCEMVTVSTEREKIEEYLPGIRNKSTDSLFSRNQMKCIEERWKIFLKVNTGAHFEGYRIHSFPISRPALIHSKSQKLLHSLLYGLSPPTHCSTFDQRYNTVLLK